LEIAGGLYREVCESPAWDAQYGSGGRAAAAISNLSPGSTLHTYVFDEHSDGISHLQALGINIQSYPTTEQIAFAYFHPLSRPHIEPPISLLKPLPSLKVSGGTVLRFGFLEGDAIINAERAIYDPQTSRLPQPFSANGSQTKELALVLNESELSSAANTLDIDVGAKKLMLEQDASVVIVKAGARGATVYERNGIRNHVPAYRSESVFKIGTGDVFSSIFAFHWGEAGCSAKEAADLASRAVASYCSTRQLPASTQAVEQQRPINTRTPKPILLDGAVSTIGRRYTLEEARFRLEELGASVICPVLGDGWNSYSKNDVGAILLIMDGVSPDKIDNTLNSYALPLTVLAEDSPDKIFSGVKSSSLTITGDFSSALYFAVWSAMSN